MEYVKKMEGEKVYLSPMTLEDAEKYTKWMNDRNVTDGIHSTAKLTNIVCETNWVNRVLEKGGYTFAIVLKKTNELIGNCGIMNPNFIDGTASLGIFIGDEENRNKGYGEEVLDLLLDYGFNMLRLHNINLGVFSFNERAINCYKKLGFKEYGRRHEAYFLDGKYYDEINMEILEDEYRKLKSKE